MTGILEVTDYDIRTDTYMKQSNKLQIFLMVSLTAIILFCTFLSLSSSLGQIREKVLRLHVIANSDSDEDQAIKLVIRDRILEYGGELFYNTDLSNDKISAKNSITQNLPLIREIARQVADEYGKEYDIQVGVEHKYFGTRQYEEVTLPAGYYDALVVEIGEAEGANWWCVMFPPMCVPAATETQELEQVMDDGELHILTDEVDYQVKFAIVEFFEGLGK